MAYDYGAFFLLVLLFDFTFRVIRRSEFSPFQRISQLILKVWVIIPAFCDESPKRFALYLGWIILLVLQVVAMLGWHSIAAAVAAILLFCAILETLFDFCIGCKIYYVIQLLKAGIRYDRHFN
ncbi:MAG: DUF4395 domain-containing protein [Sulfurimonas sp.]